MNRVYIKYSENIYDELSKKFKKLNWKITNADGTEGHSGNNLTIYVIVKSYH